jgi:predicted O-methyltransferase YrrM
VLAGLDSQRAALAAQGDWPDFVVLRVADALDVLAGGGTFDLIFEDAQGGKCEGLVRTVAALAPHGLLVVDDMTPAPGWTGEQHTKQDRVRRALLASPLLMSVELGHGSGVILATRRG